MFKKIKYENGKREIYLGGLRIFKYTNQDKFLEYILEKKLFEAYMNFRAEGVGNLKFLLRRSYIHHKYHKIFYDFYLRARNGEKLVFIDGGAHAGVFSDVCLADVSNVDISTDKLSFSEDR